jgi:hypothetical protein
MGSTGPNIKQKLFGQMAARDAVRHCDTFSMEGTPSAGNRAGPEYEQARRPGQSRSGLMCCSVWRALTSLNITLLDGIEQPLLGGGIKRVHERVACCFLAGANAEIMVKEKNYATSDYCG